MRTPITRHIPLWLALAAMAIQIAMIGLAGESAHDMELWQGWCYYCLSVLLAEILLALKYRQRAMAEGKPLRRLGRWVVAFAAALNIFYWVCMRIKQGTDTVYGLVFLQFTLNMPLPALLIGCFQSDQSPEVIRQKRLEQSGVLRSRQQIERLHPIQRRQMLRRLEKLREDSVISHSEYEALCARWRMDVLQIEE